MMYLATVDDDAPKELFDRLFAWASKARGVMIDGELPHVQLLILNVQDSSVLDTAPEGAIITNGFDVGFGVS